jgi:hypothetical protein
MDRGRVVVVGLVIAALAASAPLRAQTPAGAPADATAVWVTAGLGGGVFQPLDNGDGDPGVALLAALSGQRGVHQIQLRGTLVAQVLGDGVGEVGVLYVRAWRRPKSQSSLGAGIGTVFGEDCGGLFGGPCRSRTTVGVPLTGGITFRPVRALGLGVHALVNVNAMSSFAAVVAVIELGRW